MCEKKARCRLEKNTFNRVKVWAIRKRCRGARCLAPLPFWKGEDVGTGGVESEVMERIEREHSVGISSVQILDLLASLGIRFSEATLRKWVQLGLLPRSIRVGRKGKHAGSQGLYPVGIVRQILQIKEMIAGDLTIEQIQRDVLFVRGDIEELERSLKKVFLSFEKGADNVRSQTVAFGVAHDVTAAKTLAQQLVLRLTAIEQRLISAAVAARSNAAVG